MQRPEVSGAVRHIYASFGFKGLMEHLTTLSTANSLNTVSAVV